MSTSSFFGLVRTRLALLAALILIPALGLVLYSNLEQRRSEEARAREGALAISQLAAGLHRNYVENTRQIFGTLTQEASFLLLTTNAAFSGQSLANLRKLLPDYLTFGLIETNGILFCSAQQTNASMYLGDRAYFQRVLKTKRFSSGDFQISRLTGTPSLDFGYPVFDEKGELKRVLFAALKLSLLTDALKDIRLPTGGTITTLDRNGTILARYPDPEQWLGKSLAGTELARRVIEQKESVLELPGPDGVASLYAVTALTNQSPTLFVSVGIPLAVCFAPANQALARNFLVLGLVSIIVLAAAAVYARQYVLRPVNALMAAAADLAVGKLNARVSGIAQAGELSQLALSFNHMAESLERREEERKVAEQKLQSQMERMNLLNQITRSIGERQDLESIFQVVLRSLEEQLPIDFCCLSLYDPTTNSLTVVKVGARSEPFALGLAMTAGARIPVDENGLSRCVRGRLVYEPDVSQVQFPFPQRLRRAGLQAVVAAPLLVESKVFGVLITARRNANSFSSGECEFLRQLSEHVALAAHNAELYTTLRRAFDELRQTQQAVMQQERLRALGEMASGIAHDINNAIAPVSLYTESLLETESSLSARARDYLQIIQRSIEDVAHTVARMKEFSRQREPQLTFAPAQMNVLMQQVIDLSRARWSDIPQQRGVVIHLNTQMATDLPPFMGVESEIREALVNLIFNATDAMPDGGTLTVRTRLAPDKTARQCVVVEIGDTGVGMDEETRRRCLEPFFTTKGERGTGLGLAMVYGIVRRHDGEIEIESALGRGTVFRLFFPVGVSTVEPGKPAVEIVMPARQRILIVDDDPVLIRSLRDIMESDGHAVECAQGGQEGVDIFRSACASRKPFTVVFTDMGMPNMDGRQVAHAVKAASPSTPVIMLTGWGERLLAEKDIPPHVDQVLSKPPKLRDLRQAMSRCFSPAATGASHD